MEAVASKAKPLSVSDEMSSRRTGMSFQRTRMSADRTLMSVIRTSLSLISFGFTIAKAFEKLRESGTVNSEGPARNFGVTLVALGIGLIYYLAPDAEQLWVWITPGSLAATSLWLIGSLAFRFSS